MIQKIEQDRPRSETELKIPKFQVQNLQKLEYDEENLSKSLKLVPMQFPARHVIQVLPPAVYAIPRPEITHVY